MDSGLSQGQYTVFYVDEMLALTHRIELTIFRVEAGMIAFTQRKGRKPKAMRLKPSMLFLRGWDLGLKIDTDFSSYAGNACLNFVGNPDELRAKIDELNAYKPANKGIITYVEQSEAERISAARNKRMLYAEIADMGHAVVNRIMKESGQLAEETPALIKVEVPDGEVICDVCNAQLANERGTREAEEKKNPEERGGVALEDCYLTDYGFYCSNCKDKYYDPKTNKISGGEIEKSFKKGEEIVF
nr:hypothetical protein [uncultured Nitrososphaera sp.]